jgi:hypothetical protein
MRRTWALHLCGLFVLGAMAFAQVQASQAVYQKSKNAKQELSGSQSAPAAQSSRPHSAAVARHRANVKQQIEAQVDVASAAPGRKAAAPRGRRDPFVSPVKLVEDSLQSSAACSTGARCLIIDQIELKGVVKTTGGMIAMVENGARKQYNLRENDPVYNGFVFKITGDSIIFHQNVIDALGKQSTKEVVKRVTVPVV